MIANTRTDKFLFTFVKRNNITKKLILFVEKIFSQSIIQYGLRELFVCHRRRRTECLYGQQIEKWNNGNV